MMHSIKERFNKAIWAIIGPIRRFGIYKRLIFSFLIIIIIPNLLIGYYSFNISSKEIEDKISYSSRQALTGIYLTISEKLNLYESLSYQVYNNIQIRKLLKQCSEYYKTKDTNEESLKKYDECKKAIGNTLLQISPGKDISNLQIVNEEDQFTQSEGSGTKRVASLKDAAAYMKSVNYRKAIEADGRPVWFDTSKDIGVFKVEPGGRTYLGNYITLLRSIPDDTSIKSLGVIVITVPTKIFTNIVASQNMQDIREVVFLSGKYGIVAVLNGRYTVKMPGKELLDEIADKQDGTLVRNIKTKEYIFNFLYEYKLDTTIVYMAERSKILQGVYKVRDIIIEVAIICIICALILAYLVTASISMPMNKLKRAMGEVGENDLRIEYIDSRKDEIGVLGNKFNIMMKRISMLVDSLVEKEVLRKNEEINRKEAELNALQMQIKPHFMYNTLDLIRWNAMFEENGEGRISKMIAEFSTLLRFNAIKGNKLVEINEEIEHVKAYVKVLGFKNELKLEVEVDIPDEAILHNKINKFTFQPIVENAVKHGLIDIEKKGVVSIRAYKLEGDLLIEIKDNGIGISKDQLDQLNAALENREAATRSIGLRNVNERIKLNFGESFGIKILSEEGKYTSVLIHIPDIY